MGPLSRRAFTSRPVRPLHLGLVSVLAAVPLIGGPPALAGDKAPERQSVCRVPDIDLDYDTGTFAAVVTLPAGGCASREHTMFMLSASISRLDTSGGRDVVDRSAMCGPFRSASDFDDGEAPQYFCTLAVFLDHPDVETARYDVDVTYPGAAAERTTSVFTFCTTDGEAASCEQ
jgi:hypothetical protein